MLENMLKMQEKRASKTRARAVSRGQMRHRLFLVKRQVRGLLHVMQARHLKVSKSKTMWPNHVDKRYKRYKKQHHVDKRYAHVAKRYVRSKGESNQVSTR